MPTVILRGSKQQGQAVSRLVLEGSSSNPTRVGVLNGEPFEVTDEEFDKLDHRYVLELVGNNSVPVETESSPPDEGEDDEDDET